MLRKRLDDTKSVKLSKRGISEDNYRLNNAK